MPPADRQGTQPAGLPVRPPSGPPARTPLYFFSKSCMNWVGVLPNSLGMRIMLYFHYSDTWADPGHQAKPSAWISYDFPTLSNTVYSYTLSVLDTLKANGVVPNRV